MTLTVTFTGVDLPAVQEQMTAFLGGPVAERVAAPGAAAPTTSPEPANGAAPEKGTKARGRTKATPSEPPAAQQEPSPEQAEAASRDAQLQAAEDAMRARFGALAEKDYDSAAALLSDLGVDTFTEAVGAGLLARVGEALDAIEAKGKRSLV